MAGSADCPPTPTIGKLEGEVGPQNSLSTEYVASVSKKKKMGHPDTVMFTCGSLLQMTSVVGSKEPRQPHSSMARPRRSTWEFSGFDVSMPQCAGRQSTV